MKFEPIVENTDLDVHPDPPLPHLAVVCRWNYASDGRKRWPDAAVVAPLRTLRGIDLLVRNLLNNPQIRVVIYDGPDLTPGETTTAALRRLWGLEGGNIESGDLVRDDVPRTALMDVLANVQVRHYEETTFKVEPIREPWHERRFAYPPPPPEATTTAPHGDPGSRVAGETISEVWPLVLREIMTSGELVATHYGQTREVLNLVSVVRDPKKSALEAGEVAWLKFTKEEADDYERRVTTDWAPPGAPYSYGTRMGEQFDILDDLLAGRDGRDPESRAIFLSPWNGLLDLAGTRGRPCLVGVQFRVINGSLHGTFMFRSHDYFGGYAMNVTALCAWIVRLAEVHGFEVGTLTCMSTSAHLYDRDWHDAQKVVKKHSSRRHQWDQRSTWQVEVKHFKGVPGDGEGSFIRATALTPDGSEVIGVFTARTAQAMQSKIERSGMVTSVGNALWLGRELANAQRQLEVLKHSRGNR